MRNNKGFNLIELMVVMVIISILLALAIPKFQAAAKVEKGMQAEKGYVSSYRVVVDKYISTEGYQFIVIKENGYCNRYSDINMYYRYNIGDTIR